MSFTNVTTVQGVRILCVAEVRGKLSLLNDLAKQHQAQCILHTGNFGFFDQDSVERIPVKTLRHIVAFSPLIDQEKLSAENADLKQLDPTQLSELPKFISGELKLNVPVYTIYGASEDLVVIEKFKSNAYSVPNLHIIDETSTFRLDTPQSDLKIRLFGLGGNMLLHRFFDNGDGTGNIAGTYGLMWTTALQVGQLIRTVHDCFDESEVRIFVSHPCPSREGLLAQLALTLRADFTISSGLHFIYTSSFNEYTTAPTFDAFRGKLASARASFMDVWKTVEGQIKPLIESQPALKSLLNLCLEVFEAMPTHSTDSSKATNEYLLAAYKSMWNFNLCDVQSGVTVMNVVNGRFAWSSYSTGFDFKFRTEKPASAAVAVEAPPQQQQQSKKDSSAKTVVNGTTAQADQQPPMHSQHSQPSSAPSSSSQSAKPQTLKAQGQPQSQAYDTTTPGLWIHNGAVSADELRGFFAPQDKERITEILFRETQGPHSKKFALVYFSTHDHAKQAMERIDREKAVNVRVITPPHQRRRNNGAWRNAPPGSAGNDNNNNNSGNSNNNTGSYHRGSRRGGGRSGNRGGYNRAKTESG